MDPLQLDAFLAIAETGSFSGAATRLHLTQPAVSKRIALLESHLDSKLFDRLGKRVALTPAGQGLLPHARRILQTVADAERAIGALGGDVAGRLSIATSHHIGLHRLPPVLSEYSQRYPAVQLDLHFLDSEKALEAIANGEFDVGVVTLGERMTKPLVYTPVWRDHLHFVAAVEHPLGQRDKLSLADLTTFQAILPDAATHTTQLVLALFEQAQQPLEISMATNHLDTIRMMVSIGLGWGVLPDSLIDASLVKLPLQHAPLERQLGAVYHGERSQSNAAQQFIGQLETLARQADHSATENT